MIRQIVPANNPLIRKNLKKVTRFDENLSNIVRDLIDTMYFANAAGLAASQIGIDGAIFVTNSPPRPQIFINPKLKAATSEKETLEEGCLSVPGYRGSVARWRKVELTYNDLQGKRRKLNASGYFARILQHEYDHLQGRLYLDHVAPTEKVERVIPRRIVFFGSGSFAVPILLNLVGLNWTFDFQTVGVVTQPAKPAGRKNELKPTRVFEAAEHFGLPILTPDKLDEKFLKELKKWRVDLIVLADYGKILPPEILKLPKFGAINIHPSLLPKYRGATPIQQAILAGDVETGATLIRMSPVVDAGDIIGQYKLEIEPNDNYLSLSEKLSQLGAMLLRDLLPYYTSGEIKPIPQPKKGTFLAPKIPKDLGKIEEKDSPEDIVRKVRALNPWPGVYTEWKGRRVKILAAHLEEGGLVVDLLQIEGGRPLSWGDFKNGYPEFSL